MFPADPVPVVVEIAPGADPAASDGTWAWQDITSSVRLRDRISIVTGRQNEAGLIDPSRCNVRLDNTSGDFTPRNPNGQWYGQLGRNTPLRVRIRRGEDGFDRTESSGWGTADSGQEWTASGSAASDYSVSGGAGQVSHGTTNILRRVTLGVSLVDVEQMVDVSTPVLLTGGALVTGVLARYQDSSNYYWLRVEFDRDSTDVIVKISKMVEGTGTELGVLDPVPGLAYVADVPLRMRARVLGNQLAIKVWTASDAEPSGWHLEVTDDALTAAGATGVQSWVVAGNTNTLPLVVPFSSYTAYADRFCGFVSSWPPRWDVTGADSSVPIQADGVLRRISKGTPPARSPLRRTIAATSPVAYWPVEDGTAAGQAASALSGQTPLTVSGQVEFTKVEDYQFGIAVTFGTAALANLQDGGSLHASLPASAAAETASAWTVHVVADADPFYMSGDMALLEWTTPGGTYVRWQLQVTKATKVEVIAWDAAEAAWLIADLPTVPVGLVNYAVTAVQSGPNITTTVVAGDLTATFAAAASTLTGITSIRANPGGTTSTVNVPVGHLAVWAGSLPIRTAATVDTYGQPVGGAWVSWVLETATDRLVRLCAEDGVALGMPAVPAESIQRMGWQPIGVPLDLYRECETADQGVLHELGFGLGYVPRNARYNRAVTLTLDYTAGQVAPPLEPVDDDYLLTNRVTVRRVDGSSATAEDSASIASAGPYESSVDVSMADDTPLLDHASWRVHVGSTQVMRWPQISVNLARSPELVDDVLSVRVQSRMEVANPPAQAVGDDIDVIVEGYAETIGHRDWLVSYNTSPAQPWDVAVADGDQRVAADGSTLAADLTAGGTTLLLSSTPENGPWTTDPADMPLDIRVGGERVTASGIFPAVTDTFARTVSNGWGTADSGQSWSISGGVPSDYSVSGGTGQHIHTSVAVLRQSFITPGGQDFTIVFDAQVPVMPTGAAITVWAVIREVDTSNYYAAQLGIAPGGSTSLTLYKRVGGSLSMLASGVTVGTHTAGATWRISTSISGSALAAKAWPATASEPAGWQTTADDSTITAGTQVGVLSRLDVGNTNTLPVTVSFDNFAVLNPQSVVLSARGVNGVTRAWSAGTEVDVWTPAITAL